MLNTWHTRQNTCYKTQITHTLVLVSDICPVCHQPILGPVCVASSYVLYNFNQSLCASGWHRLHVLQTQIIYLKARGSWGKLSVIRGHSSRVNTPLIPHLIPPDSLLTLHVRLWCILSVYLSPNPLGCTREWIFAWLYFNKCLVKGYMIVFSILPPTCHTEMLQN